MIKAGGMFRFEDGETPDPLVAIKTTVKKGVSVDNCKKELKKLGTPPELIDQMAKNYSEWFRKSIFGADKKAIDNLLKTTEQFNYFANVVFGIWHRDPEIAKFLKDVPPKSDSGEEAGDDHSEDLDEGESFRANGNEDAAIDETDGDCDDCCDDIDESDIGEDNDIVIYLSKWVAWYGTSDDLNAQEHDPRIKKLQSDWVNSREFNEKDGDHLKMMIKFAEDQGFHVASIGLPYSGKLVSVDEFYKIMDRQHNGLNERYDRFGGYGGYGRKYSSYGSSAPRGESIGWYCVADVDPACKDMDRNWRFGPIEFTRGVVDFLYPERQYKRGATMLRNKHVKMPGSGEAVEVYVGIPSIFDAVKNNDEEALKKLEMIGINKNVSLGLDPDDDYTAQYVLR